MTLADRAVAYASVFPHFAASHLRVVRETGGDVLYGTWLIGNDYRRRAGFYGEYPPGYLARISALFPDIVQATAGDDARPWQQRRVLHAFAGSLQPGPYVRLDLMSDEHRQPEVVGDVTCADKLFGPQRFALTLADPPYSAADATYYATPMVSRRKAIGGLALVTASGGFLVWLDCVWPMHAKSEWRTVGRITLIRSTNHRVRLISIFERRPA